MNTSDFLLLTGVIMYGFLNAHIYINIKDGATPANGIIKFVTFVGTLLALVFAFLILLSQRISA